MERKFVNNRTESKVITCDRMWCQQRTGSLSQHKTHQTVFHIRKNEIFLPELCAEYFSLSELSVSFDRLAVLPSLAGFCFSSLSKNSNESKASRVYIVIISISLYSLGVNCEKSGFLFQIRKCVKSGCSWSERSRSFVTSLPTFLVSSPASLVLSGDFLF